MPHTFDPHPQELSMDEAYKRVEKLDLYDPLEKRKMGVQEFEMMVSGQSLPGREWGATWFSVDGPDGYGGDRCV